jgi:hypothetical protein
MKAHQMALVLDSNQAGILCDRLGKEPQLLSLDVILPPHVLAELILWGKQTCLNHLYALRPRVGLDPAHIMPKLASCNEDQIRTFRPFPSPKTVNSKLYHQLVNGLKGPSQRHHQWATTLKKTNKEFCGGMKERALDFRKYIRDATSAGNLQGAYKFASMDDAFDAFGIGPDSFIGSMVIDSLSEGGKRQVAINDPDKVYGAVMENPFVGGLFKIVLFYILSYSRMWDHNHQNLNFDPTADRDDWTDITIPLYAASEDTILTQDKKLYDAIASVYGTGNLVVRKAADL